MDLNEFREMLKGVNVKLIIKDNKFGWKTATYHPLKKIPYSDEEMVFVRKQVGNGARWRYHTTNPMNQTFKALLQIQAIEIKELFNSLNIYGIEFKL